MEEIINKDCPKSYISWMVFDQKIFSDKYFFQEVLGCDPKKKKSAAVCKASSVKKYNKYWTDPHPVDFKSYYYVNSFGPNEVKYFNDDNIKDLDKYPAIKEAVNQTVMPVKNIYLTVVRGHIFEEGIRKRVVYIFSLTEAKNLKSFCSAETIKIKLKKLSEQAEKGEL